MAKAQRTRLVVVSVFMYDKTVVPPGFIWLIGLDTQNLERFGGVSSDFPGASQEEEFIVFPGVASHDGAQADATNQSDWLPDM